MLKDKLTESEKARATLLGTQSKLQEKIGKFSEEIAALEQKLTSSRKPLSKWKIQRINKQIEKKTKKQRRCELSLTECDKMLKQVTDEIEVINSNNPRETKRRQKIENTLARTKPTSKRATKLRAKYQELTGQEYVSEETTYNTGTPNTRNSNNNNERTSPRWRPIPRQKNTGDDGRGK